MAPHNPLSCLFPPLPNPYSALPKTPCRGHSGCQKPFVDFYLLGFIWVLASMPLDSCLVGNYYLPFSSSSSLAFPSMPITKSHPSVLFYDFSPCHDMYFHVLTLWGCHTFPSLVDLLSPPPFLKSCQSLPLGIITNI